MITLPRSIQELGPRQARLCLDIEKFGNLKSACNFASRKMLVGVSGGIDSTALLIISTLLARKSGGRVFCAHVDHGLREESATDAEFVSRLCKALEVKAEFLKADVRKSAADNSIGLEEAGRIIRYDFFMESMKKLGCDFLLLGHHREDLCEDLLMRLIRGTGWPALAGMDAFDPNRNLLRPLLSTPKIELQSFLEEIGCPWREDESNQSDEYTRNRVRNRILPLLTKENPGFGNGVVRLKEQAELDENFWTGEIKKAIAHVEELSSGELLIPCSILNKSHIALRLRIYKKLLDSLGKGHALSDSMMRLDRAFIEKKTGTTIQFPGSKQVKVIKKGLLFKVIKTIDSASGKV